MLVQRECWAFVTSAEENVDLWQTVTLGTVFQETGLTLQVINVKEPAGI